VGCPTGVTRSHPKPDLKSTVLAISPPLRRPGFSQMMEQLSYERLTVGLGAVATAEQALAITTNYVKERMAVGTRDRPPLDQVVAMQP